MNTRKGTVASIEWGLASQRMPGETMMGDRAVVIGRPDGALIGVVDGLGHGEQAATAANIAIGVLEQIPDKPVTELMTICHQALHGTRGAVMSMAAINASRAVMTWVGIGNVEAIIVHESVRATFKSRVLIAQPGILGYRMPKRMLPTDIELEPGVTAVFATDGIDNTFMQGLRPVGPPDCIARRILAVHGKKTDDALVLVARYLGNKA